MFQVRAFLWIPSAILRGPMRFDLLLMALDGPDISALWQRGIHSLRPRRYLRLDTKVAQPIYLEIIDFFITYSGQIQIIGETNEFI